MNQRCCWQRPFAKGEGSRAGARVFDWEGRDTPIFQNLRSRRLWRRENTPFWPFFSNIRGGAKIAYAPSPLECDWGRSPPPWIPALGSGNNCKERPFEKAPRLNEGYFSRQRGKSLKMILLAEKSAFEKKIYSISKLNWKFPILV